MQMGNEGFSWWKNGVIYQIYPRSFLDSNNDGIGDINGIRQKLDYLKDLGITGIWLSPINRSPHYDFGYDISDYRKIDPLFGTDKDFDNLVREAEGKGIRIIMDLVMNHTSHLHPWFIESSSSVNSPKRDWYIWKNKKRGKFPNNWYSAFGGRAWEWDEKTQQYYLHSFLKEQPDVNWRNKEFRAAMFGEIKYWLDKGVKGFRLDVVNYFIKDSMFRNNPFGIGPFPRPYDLQKHIYDRNRPEMHELLQEFRSLLDRYEETMSVGEVYVESPGNPYITSSYLGDGKNELHLGFDFSLIFSPWQGEIFQKRIRNLYDSLPEKGWACHVLGNHDQKRLMTRLGNDGNAEKKAFVAALLLLTLRGTPFLYYGDEIGMTNGKIRKSEIHDPVGKKYWPFHPGRDPERTPMQWDSSEYSGFSRSVPWLPVNKDFTDRNVENQFQENNSLLSWYKEIISLRRKSPALYEGEIKFRTQSDRDIIVYERIKGEKRIMIILNFSNRKKNYDIGPADQTSKRVLLSTHKNKDNLGSGADFTLQPFEATMIEVG